MKRYIGNIKRHTFECLIFEVDFIQQGARGRHHLTEAEFNVIRHAANSWEKAQRLLQQVLNRVEQRNQKT